MLCWITILGGVLIMMGQQSRSEALFYYFRLEDQVPETHLLRLIEKHINFAFVRERLKHSPAARMSQETVAAKDMLARFARWQGHEPVSVAADTTYGNGEVLQWLANRHITPYMRTRDSIHRKNSPFFGPERFTYEPENNRYICPAGQLLNYGGRSARNRTYTYIGTRKRCGACAQRPQCTSAAFRCLAIHMDEPARQRARELANTPAFAKAQRERKKVEALFAELKNQIGLRRLRLRGLKFVREQFFMAAAAQNIKRLVRFLSQVPRPNTVTI